MLEQPKKASNNQRPAEFIRSHTETDNHLNAVQYFP